jgi:hypothetical protein
MQRCWEAIPSDRPSFAEIIPELEDIQAQAQVSPQSPRSQFQMDPTLVGSENMPCLTAVSLLQRTSGETSQKQKDDNPGSSKD